MGHAEAPRMGTRIDSLPHRTFLACCCAVLGLVAALRWTLAVTVYLRPNSDQVMVGLMARRILAGDRPAFYWGQPYNGTLESYITAAVFRMAGESYQALHVAPVFFSVLFVAALMALAQHMYGRGTALATGIVLIPAPALLMEFSVWPGYNYLQAMAFGTLALVLSLHAGAGQRFKLIPAAAGSLGLALWAQPLAVAYVPAAALLLFGPLWQAVRSSEMRLATVAAVVASAAAFLLGLGPAIVYNLDHRWATVFFLLGRPNNMHLTHLEEARRLVLWAGPVFTGLIPPTENPDVFQRFLVDNPFDYAVSLALLAAAAALVLLSRGTVMRWCASFTGSRPSGEGALLVLALTLVCAYLLSSWSSSRWSATEPRYLLPLYTLVPLVVRAIFPARASRQRLLLGWTIGMAVTVGGLVAIGSSAPTVADAGPLAASLRAEGAGAVFGDYWLVYTVAFASHERLLPVVVQPDLSLGLNRYAPYLSRGLNDPHPIWVAPAGSALEGALRRCLADRAISFSERLVTASGGSWVVTKPLASSTGATVLSKCAH